MTHAITRRRLGVAVAASLAVLVALALARHMAVFADAEKLSVIVETAGPWAVVILLALAVVVSPVPSGPIAMAAGAIYGPVEGGALTAIGALLGATIAFGLARRFGYRPLSACETPLTDFVTRARSERRLALAVFVSRLIPFISFDAISYLAGLTSIRWRSFALATGLGVMPASFAFAALGAGATEWDNAALTFAACGITLVVPVLWVAVRRFRPRVA